MWRIQLKESGSQDQVPKNKVSKDNFKLPLLSNLFHFHPRLSYLKSGPKTNSLVPTIPVYYNPSIRFSHKKRKPVADTFFYEQYLEARLLIICDSGDDVDDNNMTTRDVEIIREEISNVANRQILLQCRPPRPGISIHLDWIWSDSAGKLLNVFFPQWLPHSRIISAYT